MTVSATLIPGDFPLPAVVVDEEGRFPYGILTVLSSDARCAGVGGVLVNQALTAARAMMTARILLCLTPNCVIDEKGRTQDLFLMSSDVTGFQD